MASLIKRKVQRKPKNDKPAPVKERKLSHKTEFRSLSICSEEIDYLLRLMKGKDTPYKALLERLVDLREDFKDTVVKLKESVIRARANSFWLEEESADKEAARERAKNNKKKRAEKYEDKIATMDPKKLRALLAKEKKGNGK